MKKEEIGTLAGIVWRALNEKGPLSFEDLQRETRLDIHFYNNRRPHMSIGYKVPAVAHLEKGKQKKMWEKRFIKKTDRE